MGVIIVWVVQRKTKGLCQMVWHSPLFFAVCKQLFACNDSTCRTSVSASSAVNTYVCINNILAITFRDSTCRALASARTTHYTIVCNYVSHNFCFFRII